MKTAAFNLYGRLFARRSLYRFHKAMYYAAARGLGFFNSKNFEMSGEQVFLKSMAARPDVHVVFDIGANEGDYAKELLAQSATATVYAFEPHPKTFGRLAALKQPRLICHELGMGNTVGRAQLFDLAAEDGSCLASRYEAAIRAQTSNVVTHDIKVSTIDAFAAEHGISTIDLLKIDVEGAEYDVLLGARRMLESGAIRVLQFEFNEMNVESRRFLRDFREILSGYDFYRLLADGPVKLEPYSPFFCEVFGFQNIVAARRGESLT